MWVSKNSLLDWVNNSQLIDGEVSLCTYTESFICEFLFMSVVILKCKIWIYQITALKNVELNVCGTFYRYSFARY